MLELDTEILGYSRILTVRKVAYIYREYKIADIFLFHILVFIHFTLSQNINIYSFVSFY